MDETMKAYLAGILDADGYFTIRRSTYNLRVIGDGVNPTFSEKVGMKQVQPEAVQLLHDHFGGYMRIEKPSAKKGKPLYAWSVTNKKAVNVVRTLFPYLLLKKRQAQLLLDLRVSKENSVWVHTGEYSEIKHKSGKIVRLPRKHIDQQTILCRENLVSQVKKLNDSRSTQPRLIGKG